MTTQNIYALAATALLILGGCGGNSQSNTLKGQLVDAPVSGADYHCGDKHDITAKDGGFICPNGPITFKVGGVELGTLDTIPEDGIVTPYELANANRGDYTPQVEKIALFLQGLDDDGSYETRIEVDPSTKEHLATVDKDIHTLSKDEVIELLNTANVANIPTDDEAKKHLEEYTDRLKDEPSEKTHTQNNPDDQNESQREEHTEPKSESDSDKIHTQNDPDNQNEDKIEEHIESKTEQDSEEIHTPNDPDSQSENQSEEHTKPKREQDSDEMHKKEDKEDEDKRK